MFSLRACRAASERTFFMMWISVDKWIRCGLRMGLDLPTPSKRERDRQVQCDVRWVAEPLLARVAQGVARSMQLVSDTSFAPRLPFRVPKAPSI